MAPLWKVSKWLLFNAKKRAIYSAITWISYIQWDYDDVRFVLNQYSEFDFYSGSSFKQKSVGRHVAPLRHIIMIPSQPVFALST